MILYFSGLLSESTSFLDKLNMKELSVLQAFPYMNESKIKYIYESKNFLLDSGAFTVMNSKNKNFDYKKYTEKYGKFIKDNKINDFFELDIDGVFGYEVYQDCLHRLEDITGNKPIPVWHTRS